MSSDTALFPFLPAVSISLRRASYELLGGGDLQSPFAFIDGDVIRAHVPPTHVPLVVELPVLVAVSPVPLALFVVPLVLEPSTNAVSLVARVRDGVRREREQGQEVGGDKNTGKTSLIYSGAVQGGGGCCSRCEETA